MDEMGREVPKGEIGEICIFGDGVSMGYMGDRAKENESFVNTADGRMYKSGDLGYILPDGNIAFLHRKDTQIMILGKRVEVSEVENVLLKSDMVRQAYVAAKTDANNLSYMVAYIVKEDKETKLTDIIAYLKDYLTDFMIPDFFVELRDLPLNSNGKVDKKALPNVAKKVA
jgi:acyl-coenzyme A synthetase/AMP-(fatty) acid ligase